jgi:toxin HigB-1
MIKTFRHKGLEAFFREGSKKGIQPHHAAKLQIQLATLDNATGPDDMNAPNWRLHALSGDLAGSLVNLGERQLATDFLFVGKDAELVDYQDYH